MMEFFSFAKQKAAGIIGTVIGEDEHSGNRGRIETGE